MGIISGIRELFYIAKEILQKAFVKVKDAITAIYEKALDMMRKVLDKLKARVRGILLGAAHFFRKVGNTYQEGTRNYSLEEEIGEWHETTVTRTVEKQDIPPKYRTLDDEFEIDDTHELNEALEMVV